MARLVKFEVKEMPKTFVVGKELRYSMEALMGGDNRIPALWDSCFSEGVFAMLEAQKEFVYDKSYVGLMTDWDKGDGDFSYICGMLMKEGTPVPDGMVVREIAAGKAGVAWITGKDTADVCSVAHQLTEQKLKEQGINFDGMKWCMEFYNCPRYTTPDVNGEITLDYYIPIK